MPARNFYAALAASLLLHGLILVGGAPLLPRPALPPTPATLSATLLPPTEVTPADDALLKNTLDEGRQATPPPTLVDKGRRPPAAAERKLAEHVYYPPEAIARRWEGEVRLLLSLDGQGRIVDVQVASGSGHDVLDQAAVRAAYDLGRIDGAGKREVLWQLRFRLPD